jgi:hypothetical protein
MALRWLEATAAYVGCHVRTKAVEITENMSPAGLLPFIKLSHPQFIPPIWLPLLVTPLVPRVDVAPLSRVLKSMTTLSSQPHEGTTVPDGTSTLPPPSKSEFAWTCGNDPQLRHLRKLAVGAYSEVHQVHKTSNLNGR